MIIKAGVSLIFLILLYFNVWLQLLIFDQITRLGDVPFFWLLGNVLSLILAGFILEIPRLLKDKQKGAREIDWPILLIFGLPALYLSFGPLLAYFEISIMPEWMLFLDISRLQAIGSIWFGITLGKTIQFTKNKA